MDEKLKAFLISLGLRAEATDDEAWAYLRALRPQASTAAPGAPGTEGAAAAASATVLEGLRSEARQIIGEAMTAEFSRVESIRALCAQHGAGALENELITTRATVDQAREKILNHLATNNPTRQVGIPAGSVIMGADAGDKFRAAITYALVKDRAALNVKDLPEAPGHESFRSYSLREIARECLRFAGQRIDGHVVEMIGRALTTSDLPNILANVANKSLMAGFELHEETYEAWTDAIPAPDFKAMNLVSVSSLDDLATVLERGEVTRGGFIDKRESITLGTGARIYGISRTALINDDLNAITVVFAGAGQKARKYEGDLVYAVLALNAAMNEDGQNLFSAVHATTNIATTLGLPGIDTLNNMDRLLGAMTGVHGEMINIPMKFILCPRWIKGQTEAFFKTQQFLSPDMLRIDNPYYGDNVARIYEPRLDAASTQIWYAAGPKGSSVVRTHLNGVQTPYTEQQAGWTVDGVELKVRYDVAAGAREWRTIIRNAGVAS